MLNKQMGSNLAVDGKWGPKTQAAYEQYVATKSGKSNMPSKASVMPVSNLEIPSEEGQYGVAAGNNYELPVAPQATPEAPLQFTAPTYHSPIAPQRMGNQFKQDNMMGKNQMAYGGEYYAQGGGIHIDPSKKGTFKAQATRMGMSVQQAASHILANKEHYSSAMVKKANFAKNFAKAYGGYTYAEGGETMPEEQAEASQQQMQEQAMGQEQQPQQGGQDQMMQQLAQMVMQALQQGMDPKQIVQMLVQQGVPQEVATQVVQMVMQQMQGGAPQGGPGQQYQSQADQYQGPQAGQQPEAAYGGYYADGGMTGGMFFNQSYMPFDY